MRLNVTFGVARQALRIYDNECLCSRFLWPSLFFKTPHIVIFSILYSPFVFAISQCSFHSTSNLARLSLLDLFHLNNLKELSDLEQTLFDFQGW
jgi:hypothetical protein